MKKIIYFLGIVFICSWLLWLIPILSDRNMFDLGISNQFFIVIGTFMPSIIGFIYLKKYKNITLKSLLSSLFVLKKKSIPYLFIMPFILGISFLLITLIFKIDFDLEFFKRPLMIFVVALYILVLGGPLGEEIGWRGFVLPELLKKYNPFYSSIILGVVWSIWHLPLFYILGTIQNQIPMLIYLPYTVILTFFITIVYLKSNRSISSGVYMHLSGNLAIGVFNIVEETVSYYFIGGLMLLTLSFFLIKYKKIYFSKNIKMEYHLKPGYNNH